MEQNFPNRSHVFSVFCQMCNFIASNKCETKTKVKHPKHPKHLKRPKHPKHYESPSKGIGDAESCETPCKRESSAGTNERSLVTMPPSAELRRGSLMITSYGFDNDWHLKTPPKKHPSHQSKISYTKIPTKPPTPKSKKGTYIIIVNPRMLKVVVTPSQNEGFYNFRVKKTKHL